MSAAYVLTPRALDDLDEIWRYIAADNETAATRVESAILGACKLLARNPLIGSKRREVTSLPVRFWVVTRYPNFIVVYRPETAPLEVISVLHAKRNIKRLIAERMGR
ncbi:MAG: type II toxin-antitoxin system RelE/ParE family toxin [Terracidiphilus sp.]